MKRLITGVNILLIGITVYFVIDVFYAITTDHLDQAILYRPDPKIALSEKKHSKKALSHYKAIVNRNLFNTNNNKTKRPDAINLETLEKTDLTLKLWGTITIKGSAFSYAVLESKGSKKQNLYKEGDVVENSNAVVKLILREKIVLNVNGRDEILDMESTGKSSIFLRIPEKIESPSARIIPIKRSQIENAMSNIADLMKQVQMRLHYENGNPDGIIVDRIQLNTIFGDMGLRKGDIIKEINGDSIESVESAFKFMNNLETSSTVNVKFLRRGREKMFNYNIE